NAASGTDCCSTASFKSRSCPRGRVWSRSRGSHCVSDHRIWRRRRPPSFWLTPVLERLHSRKLSDLHFPRRALLLLVCGSCSEQRANPGLVRIRSGCEAFDMTRRCASRPGLSIGEIHLSTAHLVDDPQITGALLPLLS